MSNTLKFWLAIMLAMLSASAVAGDTLPAPIQALQRHGLVIRGEMPAPPGFKAYLADYKGGQLPVYLLPDGKHVMVGDLFDANGQDLTSGPYSAALRATSGGKVWKALADSTWIAEGAKHPQRVVYVISDTECKYCHALWTRVEPMLAEGKRDLQVRYVLAAVISKNSLGRAAAILSSKDPAAALRRHEAHFDDSPFKPMKPVPAKLKARIEANNRLMAELGAQGTPVILYRDAKGRVQMIDGMPSDPAHIRKIFGS